MHANLGGNDVLLRRAFGVAIPLKRYLIDTAVCRHHPHKILRGDEVQNLVPQSSPTNQGTILSIGVDLRRVPRS